MPSRRLRQFPAPPPPAAAATATRTRHSSRRASVLPAIVATSVCLLIVFFFAAAVAVYRLGRRRRSRPEPAPAVDQEFKPEHPHRFSYEELSAATASFAPSNKLGQGGFGPVFRGVLGDGREVAVKVMEDGSLQGEREFRNELSIASSLALGADSSGDPSRFVVSCIGFCSDDEDGALGRRGWTKRKRRKRHGSKSSVEEEADKWGIRGRRRGRTISSAFSEDEEEEEEESRPKGRRSLLVYELMPNGSLQDALLDRKCPELLQWPQRFSITLDVARGIEFLHFSCEPPVIHGDVKPSNILLDLNFSAKIADFGLARTLSPMALPVAGDDAGSVVIADDVSTTVAETESTCTIALDDLSYYKPADPIPAALHKEASDGLEAELGGSMRLTEPGELSPMAATASRAMDAGSLSEVGGGGYDKLSVDSGAQLLTPGSKRWRRKTGSEAPVRDWWRRQESVSSSLDKPEVANGRPTVKDYVMEWIGAELRKERPKPSWADASSSNNLEVGQGSKQPDQKKRLDWWASLDERWLRKKGKNRAPREWWREEFCEELTRKNMKKKKKKRQGPSGSSASDSGTGKGRQWWEKDEDVSEHPSFRKKGRMAWSRGSRSSVDRWTDGLSGELRVARGRTSHDWAGGDVPKSGGISSTPSMRGTVCYAAPEYGGGGLLSEKCDIYSFGVLLLVLISGRRPLQVTASPMADFERANLISWARHLARAGKLMDLVDASLQSLDRDQALLCITVALLCLQRSPSRRPTIKEVVAMLSGESEPPHLPMEFSPSPPSGFPYKSRWRAR
ncbi:protein kinase superfamily protein [Wolffia australiana]